jgi:hypothetical protein
MHCRAIFELFKEVLNVELDLGVELFRRVLGEARIGGLLAERRKVKA